MTMQNLNIAARYNIDYCAKILLEISAKLGILVKDVCIYMCRS